MQRFGFSAAHLQLTLLDSSPEKHFDLQYLWESRSHVDQAWLAGSLAGKAVPTLLCSCPLNAQKRSYPRWLKGKQCLAEPPGLLIVGQRPRWTTRKGNHFQLHELDAERQSEECHQEPSSQDCREVDLSSFWRLSETGPTSSV